MAVYLWAVIHDRPTSWACNPINWPKDLWPRMLPSQSTMSRRVHTTEVQRLLTQLEEHLRAADPDCLIKFVDGKPLLVGSHSKDPDAAWGRARRGWAKGYKLHALYDAGSLPVAWDIASLNEAEPDVAAHLISSIKRGGGYILGDCSYDSNPLHELATGIGCQLVAQRKRPNSGLGHRRHTPGRMRSIALLQTVFGRELYAFRDHVERQFGWLTNHGGGLAPLPNWVRTMPRVRLWVQAKLLVHAMYVYLTSTPNPLAVA